MKLRKTKKGFTIVELVIVIAVIGILTAVLVPTFINLANKANEASDDSLVRNLNTALRMEEQKEGHKKSMTLQGAIDDLIEEGYILENLVAKSGKDLLWDQEENQFLINRDGVEGNKYWQIVNALPEKDQAKYSYYAGKNFSIASTENELKYGFDAGYNEDIAKLTFTGADSAPDYEVVIRTNNYNTVLTVNAPSDVVKHYGKANKVDVIAVAGLSYHEHGDVLGNITLNNGRVVVEEGAKANAVYVDATAEAITAGTVTVSADNSKEPEVPIILRDYVKDAADDKGGNNSIPNPATHNVIVLSDKVTVTNPETGEVTKTEVTAIAYNKTTKQNYASLAEAVAEADSGNTIIMMNNDTTSEQMINITKDITIDGNGYTYTNSNKNSRIIAINGTPDGVYKSYNVTIKNINIVSSYTGSVAINNKEPRGIVAYQLSGAKINISNVKVDMAKDDYTFPVKLLYVENTEVNIENSYLKGANCIECQYIQHCEFNIADTTLYSNYTKEKPAFRGNGINFTNTCSNNKITFVDTLFMSDGNSNHFDIDGVYNTVNGELVDFEED